MYLVFLFVSSFFCAEAQTAENSSLWSIVKAYEIAVNHSDDLILAIKDENISTQAIHQARARTLPQIRANYSWLTQESSQDSFGQSFAPSTQNTFKLNLKQNLFKGFENLRNIQEQKENFQDKSYRTQDIKLTLFKTIALSYIDILSRQRQREDLLLEKKANEERMGDLSRWVAIGKARRSDIMQIESNILNIDRQLEDLNISLQNDLNDLRLYITNIPDRLPNDSFIPALENNLEREVNLNSRPDLQSMYHTWKASEKHVAALRARRLPSVDLDANYYPYRDSGPTSDINWDISLLASFPIFTGGENSSVVKQALIQASKQKLIYEQSLRKAELNLKKYQNDLEGIFTKTSILEKSVTLAKNRLDIEKKQFNQGISTNQDVLSAMANLFVENRNLHISEYEWKKTWINYQVESGMILKRVKL